MCQSGLGVTLRGRRPREIGIVSELPNPRNFRAGIFSLPLFAGTGRTLEVIPALRHNRLIWHLNVMSPQSTLLRMLFAPRQSGYNLHNYSRHTQLIAIAFVVVFFLAGIPVAYPAPVPASLSHPIKQAFERYISLTDARNSEELRQGTPFLWVDSLPEGRRMETYASMKRGEVAIERLETYDNGNAIQCPGGLIHHWVGALWIPGATLAQTLALVQAYDRHVQVYAPFELRSKILERNGDDFKVSIRYLRKKIITVVLDTIFQIEYHVPDPTHAWSHGRTQSVREIKNHDTSSESALPEGEDGGYLWGMSTYWRFVERDGGTYVQSESVSLTTRVPAGLGWLIEPYIKSVPRESLEEILNDTRKGVLHPPTR